MKYHNNQFYYRKLELSDEVRQKLVNTSKTIHTAAADLVGVTETELQYVLMDASYPDIPLTAYINHARGKTQFKDGREVAAHFKKYDGYDAEWLEANGMTHYIAHSFVFNEHPHRHVDYNKYNNQRMFYNIAICTVPGRIEFWDIPEQYCGFGEIEYPAVSLQTIRDPSLYDPTGHRILIDEVQFGDCLLLDTYIWHRFTPYNSPEYPLGLVTCVVTPTSGTWAEQSEQALGIAARLESL